MISLLRRVDQLDLAARLLDFPADRRGTVGAEVLVSLTFRHDEQEPLADRDSRFAFRTKEARSLEFVELPVRILSRLWLPANLRGPWRP